MPRVLAWRMEGIVDHAIQTSAFVYYAENVNELYRLVLPTSTCRGVFVHVHTSPSSSLGRFWSRASAWLAKTSISLVVHTLTAHTHFDKEETRPGTGKPYLRCFSKPDDLSETKSSSASFAITPVSSVSQRATCFFIDGHILSALEVAIIDLRPCVPLASSMGNGEPSQYEQTMRVHECRMVLHKKPMTNESSLPQRALH